MLAVGARASVCARTQHFGKNRAFGRASVVVGPLAPTLVWVGARAALEREARQQAALLQGA